ncbi:MAG: hypothetical protein H0U74_20620 [Bradymonadaceae bacterium]|nr:hypothetical protein [Lujinxingiaceae bacterium]
MKKCFAWSTRAILAAGLLVCVPAFAEEPAAEPEQELEEQVAAEQVAADEEQAQALDQPEPEPRPSPEPQPAAEPEVAAVVEEPAVATESIPMTQPQAEVALDAELDSVLGEDAALASKPWSVSGGLRMVVGQGTFMTASNNTQYADTIAAPNNAYDRVGLVLSLSGAYRVSEFSFGLGIGMTQWLTANSTSIANEAAEFRLQDISLSAGWNGHTFESTGISISPGLSFSLPTSKTSRASTLLFDSSLSVDISRTFFSKLTLAYSLSGTKFFHQFTSPTISLEEVGFENALYRAGEQVSPTHIAIDGYNSEFAVGNALSASIPIWSTLSASVSYGLYSYWTYYQNNDDQFAPDAAISCSGRCMSQVTANSVGLRYGINDWLNVRGSLNTTQPPKTSDNKSFRFPFWNFNGPASNYSSFNLSIGASY